MGGWRDVEGRTASERRRLQDATERAEFVDAVRNRPFSFLKGVAGFVAIAILALALIFSLR